MADDFVQRFGGIARLYGNEGIARLRRAHVCVIGVGGVGSWAVEALARSGIGALTLIDLDDVCVTNTNRQLPALDGQFGRPKVDVLAERVRLIHPDCHVERRSEFFTASSAARLLEPRYDFVIDATDRLTNKCLIISGCRKRAIPVLTVGGAGGKRDATAVRVGDLSHSEHDELLRQVRKKLRRDFEFPREHRVRFGVACVYSPERPIFPWSDGTCSRDPEPGTSLALDCASGFGTASFVTGVFGLAAAGEVVRQITSTVRVQDLSAE